MVTRKRQTSGKTKAIKTSPTRMAITAIAQAKKKATAGKGIVRWHGENTGVYFPSYMLHPDNHQPLPKYKKQISNSLQKRGISVKEYKKGGVATDPTKKEVRKKMRAVNKMDRQDKRWNRKDDRIQAREERKTNKENAKILMASKRF